MNNKFENREAFRSFEQVADECDSVDNFKFPDTKSCFSIGRTGRGRYMFDAILQELTSKERKAKSTDSWYPILVTEGKENRVGSRTGQFYEILNDTFFDFKLYEQPNPTPEHSATSYKKSKRKLPPTHSTKPKTPPSKLLMKLLSQGKK